MTKKDLLAQFTQETKTITIKAWDNAEVKIRKLTIKEQAEVNALIYGDLTLDEAQEGTAHIDLLAVQESQILSASYALVEPSLTVDEIKNLPSDALEGISEIQEALTNWSEPKK